MATCPTDSFFSFDYICNSFLSLFEQNITHHLLTYLAPFKTYPSLIPQTSPSTAYTSVFNPPSPTPILKPSTIPHPPFISHYSLLSHITQAHELEHYLSQIKTNCFDVMSHFDLQKGFTKIKSIQFQLRNFSEDITNIKHLIFSNKCEYYGETLHNDSYIKHGFGMLIFHNSKLTYIGIFNNDAFTSGLFIQENKRTIYKGKFINNVFVGSKIIYNLHYNVIEHLFFGTITLSKGVYTGCSIKYFNQNYNTASYLDIVKISYFNHNNLSLTLEYYPNDIRKILLKHKDSWIQYSNEGYLLEMKANKEGNVDLNKALYAKVNGAFYMGDVDKRMRRLHGKGVVVYEDGSYYKGGIKLGIKEGSGVFGDAKKGLEYDGVFDRDEFVKGKIVNMKNGEIVFEGEINENSVWKGKIKYKNGDIYEGEGKGDVREGYGVYYYNTERNYTIGCHWENNVKKGPLVCINIDNCKIMINKRDTNTTDTSLDDNNRNSNFNTSTISSTHN